MIRKMLGEVAMMPVNGLEPEPALGSVLFAEGAEMKASGAGTGVTRRGSCQAPGPVFTCAVGMWYAHW